MVGKEEDPFLLGFGNFSGANSLLNLGVKYGKFGWISPKNRAWSLGWFHAISWPPCGAGGGVLDWSNRIGGSEGCSVNVFVAS